MVFPLPTSPNMYSPFGRFSGIARDGPFFFAPPNRPPKNDFGGGCRSSMEGGVTSGGVYSDKVS